MGYKESIQIKNIGPGYIQHKYFIYYVSPDKCLKQISFDGPPVETILFTNVFDFWIIGNRIYISFKDGNFVTYDIDLSKTISNETELNMSSAVVVNDCLIAYESKQGLNKPRTIRLRNICLSTDDFIINGGFDYFSNVFQNFLISSGGEDNSFRSSIIAYDLTAKTVAWKYDLKEIGKYYNQWDKKWIDGDSYHVKVLGAKVFVLTHPKLICLDAVTSSVIWMRDVRPGYKKIIHYTELTNELLLFDMDEFWFLNPETGEVIRRSDSFNESFKKIGMVSDSCTYPVIDGNYIYITFVYEYKLLILDKYTFEVTDVIDLSKTFMDRAPMSEPPIVYDKFVIQSSLDSVLHVFERQD